MANRFISHRFSVTVIRKTGQISVCTSVAALARMSYADSIALIAKGSDRNIIKASQIRKHTRRSYDEFVTAYDRSPDSMHEWMEIANTAVDMASEGEAEQPEAPDSNIDRCGACGQLLASPA